MVAVRGERAHPILRSSGESVCSGSFSFHRQQPLAPRPSTTESERSRTVGANEPAHPPLAASSPYLPSVWPQASSGTVSLSRAQLSMLLEGIDWRRPERTWEPELSV